MAKAMELGLHGVESAFCVPQLTSDIGAAYKITSLWFPRALVDLRSGGGATHHIAMLVDRAAGCHAAISNVSGAAALSEALIRASAFVDRDAIPALRPSG
jgi:hypothetical protein